MESYSISVDILSYTFRSVGVHHDRDYRDKCDREQTGLDLKIGTNWRDWKIFVVSGRERDKKSVTVRDRDSQEKYCEGLCVSNRNSAVSGAGQLFTTFGPSTSIFVLYTPQRVRTYQHPHASYVTSALVILRMFAYLLSAPLSSVFGLRFILR